ncbi:helix-turn-helix transcriptional regulator [Rhodopirellula sp. SWK7]|uniref:helix-turn-helix transcriptional regulator n=1 Tax=Rhodopirellula sp. SWK7 TaxID=595460 RepID=UPI0005C443E1|nr:AraC family transcriptional regulator [Rhodopirellula sp. SWK7]
MSRDIPTFSDPERTHWADSCRPLSDAAEHGMIEFHTLVHGHYPGRTLPEDVLPGLKTVGFWDSMGNQNWGLDWHCNEGIELALLERGSLDFSASGKQTKLLPGDLTLTRPWQKHRVGAPNVRPSRLHWFIIDLEVRRPHQEWRWPHWIVLAPADLKELTTFLRHNDQTVWRDAAEVRRCFTRIADVIQNDATGTGLSWLTVLLNELLIHMLDLIRSQDAPIDKSLATPERTVELFLDDLRSEPRQLRLKWSVRLMAHSCGLGVTRFTDHCRDQTEYTPMQYLNRLRLEFATQLMRDHPEMTNAKLADSCGFRSASYFATAFRKQFGCTPHQFSAQANPK